MEGGHHDHPAAPGQAPRGFDSLEAPRLSSATVGLALGILSNVISGSSYFLSKLALDGFTPATLLLLRTAIAVPLLACFAPRFPKEATRGDWYRMVFIGTVGLALPHVIGVYGLRDTESLNAGFLVGIEPVAIVLLSALFLGERITRPQGFGTVFAVVGATIIVSRGDLSTLALDPRTRGNLLLVVSSILWGTYTIAAKPTLERVPPIAVTQVTTLVSLVSFLPMALFDLPAVDWERATRGPALAAAIALGVLVSFVATVLWNVSLRTIKANEMAILIFVQPLTAAVVSVIAGESVPAITWLGGAFVLIGVYLAQLRRP